MKKNHKTLSLIFRLIAGIMAVLTLCYAIPKWSLVLPIKAAEAVTAEEKQAVKKLEEELAVLKGNRTFARESYEAALAAYEAAELDYVKAQKAKEALDAEITALESEIDTTNTLLNTYNEQLDYYTGEIAVKETEIEQRWNVFLDRVRINYEDSFTSYLEIVLSSDSFSDLLYRVDIIASLLDYDKQVLAALDTAKKDLTAMQTEYQSLQFKAQETLSALMEQLPLLEDKRAESAELLAELDAKVLAAMQSKETSEAMKAEIEASYNEKAAQLAKAEAEIEEKIRRAQEEAARRAREEAERKRKEEEERKKQEAANQQSSKPSTTTQNKTPNVTGKYVWPTEGAYTKVSSYFGWRTSPLTGKPEFHNGIDIPAGYGTAIYAADGGTVLISEKHYSYGNYIVIDHGNGLSTLYAHNTKNLVKVGDVVDRGQQIATCGSSGDSTGNHLHFSVRIDGSPVNPMNYISNN
ncbi:MAG: peptidoglycan DD-metalloendopeptidase family protein [Clostridia bacterium]|nr:peptidoglycan DD-metalloendopeptidase family protein [Clostridia bacterium]